VPHGRRSERINERDLEVLEFLARFGTVPREVVARWAGCGRSVTYERERRLRAAGLIEVVRGPGESDRLLLATPAGRRACGRPELAAARPSLATLHHESLLADLGARLEIAGERVLSEREIVATERMEGSRLYSADLGRGRVHRADLIRLGSDGPEAIEVELTVKGAARLDALLRAWRFALAEGRLAAVTYRCAPRTRGPLERALGRTATAGLIGVADLEA
jgi:DNA-binding MarR family transcriptional regulator